jgi:chemotaxis protein CheD
MEQDAGAHQVVGIGELKVSDQRDHVLATGSLGSGIALSLYDPGTGAGGLMHCLLPLAKVAPARAAAKPALFTDTGVPALLEALAGLGAERSRLIATLAGVGSLLDDKNLFKIGGRNYTVLRKLLWKNDLLLSAEYIGGAHARAMYLYLATGETIVKAVRNEEEENAFLQ